MSEGLTVLSLFDGISCGKVALERAGIPIKAYYASEIEPHAMAISEKNHPGQITRLGDVTKVRYENGILYSENGEFNVGKIDLLIGGSPCQGLSLQGNREGLKDIRSILFYEYVRLKKECNPDKFLLENVCTDDQTIRIMNSLMGVAARYINSCDFSVQARRRMYWFNWDYQEPKVKNTQVLKDIMELGPNREYHYETQKMPELRADYKPRLTQDGVIYYYHKETGEPFLLFNKLHQSTKTISMEGKVCTILAQMNRQPLGLICDDVGLTNLTCREVERVFGLPDDYTANAPGCTIEKHRRHPMGNGWEVNTIAYIFSQINNPAPTLPI